MKKRKWMVALTLLSLIAMLAFIAVSCGKTPVSPEEGPSDAFIQKLIAYLSAYGGATEGVGSGGEPDSTTGYRESYIESLYVDTIDEHGEHIIGYYYYDDGGTPWPDISDDLWGFKGIKIYRDNEDTTSAEPDSIIDRIWYEIHIPYDDRRVMSTGKNITEGHHNYGDSAYVYLEKVDAIGGKQSGKGMFFDEESGQDFQILFGLDHKTTPDYWDDNTHWMEFELRDDFNDVDYLVHIDYESWDVSQQTGHGGSGWIRVEDVNGPLIATIDFDSTGWGWLTIIPTGQKFRIYIG